VSGENEVGRPRGLTRNRQGRRDVVLHQQQLAKSAERKGIAGRQHHCLLQRALGTVRIVIPQGRDPQCHLSVGVAGIQLHGPTQELAGFTELHPVAVDHAQVVEALHVLGFQLQPFAQQGDRLVVTAGLQMGGDRFAGGLDSLFANGEC
jgi:hypothetical protein